MKVFNLKRLKWEYNNFQTLGDLSQKRKFIHNLKKRTKSAGKSVSFINKSMPRHCPKQVQQTRPVTGSQKLSLTGEAEANLNKHLIINCDKTSEWNVKTL